MHVCVAVAVLLCCQLSTLILTLHRPGRSSPWSCGADAWRARVMLVVSSFTFGRPGCRQADTVCVASAEGSVVYGHLGSDLEDVFFVPLLTS